MKVKLFKNLVNSGTIDNTYNWGWSNWYSTDETYSPRFNAELPYVPPDRTFHYPVNDKTYPKDIQCHFDRLHDLSNNCAIEEILPESSGNSDNFIPTVDTVCPGS